jgi:fluoroquinolone transport system permease protein
MLAALRRDVLLHWRQGLWLAYACVCLAYVAVLQLLGPQLRGVATMLVVFSDPAVLGFFFIGGVMLLERGEGTLTAGFSSPLRIDEWIAAKLGSLTLLAVIASLAIALPLDGVAVRPLWLLIAVIPTSTCFVLIGIVAGTRFTTVNRYMIGGGLLTTPLMLPMLAPLGLLDSPVFSLLPSGAGLELLSVGLGLAPVQVWPAVRALVVLGAWNLCLWQWARAWMRRHVLA